MKPPLTFTAIGIALTALLIYMVTLSHGVTNDSLALTAKLAGWNWLPMTDQPLLWLLTLPLRLLPSGWMPMALNLCSAFCAALVLGIMARSVELLPWPRPLESVGGWGRLPVWLAVSVCGLEYHFWQEATAASGEMLDVLLLAAALWCLLEFRINNEWRWLRASVLIWGLGVAQNWMMALTLPLFVVGLAWLRPLDLLRWRFVLRLGGWGLAGFSVYLLLPLVNGLQPGSPWDFSEAWLVSLKFTKQQVFGTFFQFWRAHRLIMLALVVYYLLPLAASLVRFGDDDTANKSSLDQFQIWLFRALRAGLLLFCVWLAFDPVNGPHGILLHKLNLTQPLLSFDYINGLGTGFLAGNLLLMWRSHSKKPRYHYQSGFKMLKWLERAARPAVLLVALFVAGTLIVRNAGAVTDVNRHPLIEFGEASLRSLPNSGGVVLADSPERLAVFQAAQAKSGSVATWLPVDTRLLPSPEYRERLNRLRPGAWLLDTNRHALAPREMVQLLGNLAQTNRVFYLHPSFGYFFESFYLEPCGLVAELKPYPPRTITPPTLTSNQLSVNEQFWNDFTPRLDALQHVGEETKHRVIQNIEKKLHLETVVSGHVHLLEEWYAVALNNWGVALQRAGRLPEAERRFSQAMALDSKSWTARANLFCNTNLQAGKSLGLADVGSLASEFRTIQNVASFLGRFGPLDEPAFCYLLGGTCVQAGLPRQALIQLERSATLVPSVPAPQLALANLYAQQGLGDQSLQVIRRVRELMKKSPDYPLMDLDLSLLEAGVNASQTNIQRSMQILQSLLDRYPGNTKVEGHVLQAYVSLGNLTNAELVASSLISRQPEEIGFQLIKSGILIRTGRADEAIPLLDHILAITNSLPAKINRAIAYLQITNVAAAKAGYLELQNVGADPLLVNLGLAEVALRESNTNLAISYFASSLSNTPSGSIQWQVIRKRLDALSP